MRVGGLITYLLASAAGASLLAPPPCQEVLQEGWNTVALMTSIKLCIDSRLCASDEHGRHIAPRGRDVATQMLNVLRTQADYRLADLLRYKTSDITNKCRNPSTKKECILEVVLRDALKSTVHSSSSWRVLNLWSESRRASLFFGNPTIRVTKWDINVSNRTVDNNKENFCPSQTKTLSSLILPPHLNSTAACPVLPTDYRRLIDKELNPRIMKAYDRMNECPAKVPRHDFDEDEESTVTFSSNKQQCECLKPNERLMTFLYPLGHGKEAEVWRVCIWDGHQSEITAFKLFRRQFRGLSYMKSRGIAPEIPQTVTKSKKVVGPLSYDHIWAKVKASLTDAIEFSAILPHDIAVLTSGIYDVCTDSLPLLTPQRWDTLNRYVVYLGLGATFPQASSDLQVFVNGHEDELTIKQIQVVAQSLLKAAMELETLGFIWMDLKPQNILMVDGVAKIGDIGFMKPINEMSRKPGIGTAGYRPFEAFADSTPAEFPITASRVSFALGVSIYALLFGALPWTEAQIRGMSHKAVKLDHWNIDINYVAPDEVPPEVTEVLLGLLHPNPVRRWSLATAAAHPFFLS